MKFMNYRYILRWAIVDCILQLTSSHFTQTIKILKRRREDPVLRWPWVHCSKVLGKDTKNRHTQWAAASESIRRICTSMLKVEITFFLEQLCGSAEHPYIHKPHYRAIKPWFMLRHTLTIDKHILCLLIWRKTFYICTIFCLLST